ncbi:MAG: MBL fold metallo-hydrolase [Isosphaeraceae bacterium]
MAVRISPLWWPLWALSSPVVATKMLRHAPVFRGNCMQARALNTQRIDSALRLDLPELDFLELTVLVDEKTRDGFRGDPGVSYLIETDRGVVLFDVGFGPDSPTLAHNLAKLDKPLSRVESVVISHLHPDHMGGLTAYRERTVRIPPELSELRDRICYLPDEARAPDFRGEVVREPRMVGAGIATTGPLARSMYFHGICEEQVLLARLRNRGLVVITGCGHPTVQVILEMVRHLADEPVFALAGGLHFPLTESRVKRRGLQVQMFMGTGKPPWRKIRDEDLTQAIACINTAGIRQVLISGHDSCDHAIERMSRELDAETSVLAAGGTYRL